MSNPLELSGEKFGKLLVLKRVESDRLGKSQWLCKCDCGNEHITTGSRLAHNKVKSCGCIQKEVARSKKTKHGLSSHKLYSIRKEMISRTTNPKNKRYEKYGGRGIKVCDEWLDKESGLINFYNWSMKNGYKEGLSIDRINNDGDYKPSNCRWTTNDTQANNKTTSKYVTYNGKTQTIKEWSDELGYSRSLIADRLRLGWDVEKTLTTPPRKISK